MRIAKFLVPAWIALVGAASAEPVVVEAVQYPAWLERGGAAVPLAPGMALQAQDRVRTGPNARVRLRLSEGSAVKLGEGAQFAVDQVDERNVFRASLRMLSGAFRFTTTESGAGKSRDIAIRVKNVSAGIRGTDLWGKATDARDFICLIEGRISVSVAGQAPVTLDKPLDFYEKPADAPARVARVDEKQLAEWARETEMTDDGAAAEARGRWRVVAGAFQQRDDAMELNRRLRSAGYPAVVVPKGPYFLVQVPGLGGERYARSLMAGLRSFKGVEMPSVAEGEPER